MTDAIHPWEISTEGRRDSSNTGNVLSCQPHEERKEKEKEINFCRIALEFSLGLLAYMAAASLSDQVSTGCRLSR